MTLTMQAHRERDKGHICFIWSDGTVEVNGRPAKEASAWATHETEIGTYGPIILHDGSACPIDPDAQMIARTRDGQYPYIGDAIWKGHRAPETMWLWGRARGRNASPLMDIVAYQVKL